MIEIIYDEKQNDAGRSMREKYELPKNIRQVGNAPGGFKIYIEDYVMTYLRRIASPGNTSCRGAILLGRVYEDNKEKIMFISGAVDAQNLEFDISVIHFGDSVWSGLYSEINKYFDDLSVVGWFLSRMGFTAEINEQMKRLHRENFQGDEKVLFLMDSLECEEAFYYYENGSIVREKGYYIYYVRNEKMQNYIISRKNNTSEAAGDRVLLNDKTVVENFRKKENGRRERERSHIGVAAASFVAVCALSFGALWYASPESVAGLGSKLTGDDDGEVKVFMNSGGNEEENPELATPTQYETESVATDEGDADAETNSVMQDARAATKAEATESTTDVVAGKDNVYEVVAGDTLVSISIRMYGTYEYAERIAAANGMSIDDPIYEGEKIIIPYVD